MHSKLVTLTLVLLHLTFLNAQELPGTTWTGIYAPTHDTISIEFGLNDTIYLEDSIFHDVAVASYEMVAGQLNFTDLEGTSECHITPATYQVEIGTDTLHFYEVNDLCSFRVGVLTNYKWIHAKHGLHKPIPKGDIELYPSRDEMTLFIELPGWFDRSEYKIITLSQQLMLEGEITREDPSIDVSTIANGKYIFYLAANQQTYRMVIGQQKR